MSIYTYKYVFRWTGDSNPPRGRLTMFNYESDEQNPYITMNVQK